MHQFPSRENSHCSRADQWRARRNSKVERALKRDEIWMMNRHRASGCCLSMIFSENRCALFRIMLYRDILKYPLPQNLLVISADR